MVEFMVKYMVVFVTVASFITLLLYLWYLITKMNYEAKKEEGFRRWMEHQRSRPQAENTHNLDDWEAEQAKIQAERERKMALAIAARLEAEKALREENERIQADFHTWFIDFGVTISLTDYDELTQLLTYVTDILNHCQDSMGLSFPIRKTHAATVGGVGLPPNERCISRLFFERLSKELTTHGILTTVGGPHPKKLVKDWRFKLRPASSVQRQSVQS